MHVKKRVLVKFQRRQQTIKSTSKSNQLSIFSVIDCADYEGYICPGTANKLHHAWICIDHRQDAGSERGDSCEEGEARRDKKEQRIEEQGKFVW